ncbi:DUF2877 domain-containing protein [Paenibacillus macerans]|uniref:DUF2877 domain-containing protein n=1 Tax=Paenibacillus macerans TaxID=44252 RepID=UPI000EE0BB94|nr:DUF2877 domain-containing protein [Paenibacillus macerans]GBK60269.1 DUF2877 domain-containing protein [Paenibacillus macerans]GBK66567.1 DUF2877 domain-containing protein [Paenibacillus macerans]GIP12224.1 hypothetical protein J1TS5_43940 [Paenibacillus macerans]
MNKRNIKCEKVYISPYVQHMIQQKGSILARIHSIFSNGFNLTYKDRLLFVGKDLESLSAIGLAIDAADFKLIQAGLSVGDPVKISSSFSRPEEKLSLIFICYTRPQVTTMTIPSVHSVDLSIPYVPHEQLDKSDLLHLLEEAVIWEQSGFASSPLKPLYENFVNEPNCLSEEAVRALIGAGVGLTPAGDDFLQGQILFERITGSGTFLTDMTQRQLQHRSTTDVSRAYYQALFDGYANAQWIKLCQAIQSENKQQLTEAIKKIQAYGATSGNDTLIGVLTFLKQANGGSYGQKNRNRVGR